MLLSEKNRVGRSVKKKFIIFWVKNVCFKHVLRWLGVGAGTKNSEIKKIQDTLKKDVFIWDSM